MPKKMEGLEQLLMDELQDLYDAEKQLVRALPRMAKAATDKELETAFRDHLEVTKGQVQRLEQVFESMNARARSRPCAGMRGLVEEGQHILGEDMEEPMMDAAITSAGRKVEHYEMVGYETVVSLARQLGMKDVAEMLRETMGEEQQADKQLAAIGKRLLKEAQSGSRMESGEPEPARRGSRQGSAPARGAGSNGRGSGKAKRGSQRNAGGSGQPLTDHDQIQEWAEERGAHPACVRQTGGKGDIGMIRLDFPGYTGEDSLQEISWDEWFEKFDENKLALIVQETTGGGQKSNFNKLVKREGSAKPKARAAR